MKTNFLQIIHFVLAAEGGYVNDPTDEGGETNMGITDKQDGRVDHLVDVDGDGKHLVPIKSLSIPDAVTVYHRNYWNPIQGDSLPSQVDAMVFDSAVNCGVTRSIMLLQTACGITADGILGPATFAAASHPNILNLLVMIRKQYYQTRKTYPRFGKGWFARVDRCSIFAKGLPK